MIVRRFMYSQEKFSNWVMTSLQNSIKSTASSRKESSSRSLIQIMIIQNQILIYYHEAEKKGVLVTAVNT